MNEALVDPKLGGLGGCMKVPRLSNAARIAFKLECSKAERKNGFGLFGAPVILSGRVTKQQKDKDLNKKIYFFCSRRYLQSQGSSKHILFTDLLRNWRILPRCLTTNLGYGSVEELEREEMNRDGAQQPRR